MALDDVRRASLMAYCRIDVLEPGETTLLETLYDAAVAYMEQAGVSEPAAGTSRKSQYDLCINYLVLDGFDRRDITIAGTMVSENPAFRRLINQLKLTEPVPDSGTGSGMGG